MTNKIAISFVNVIVKNNNFNQEFIEKMIYSVESIILSFSKLIIILFFSSLLGIIKETLLLIILIKIPRYFAFGFHARNSWECLILSIIIFIVIPLFFIENYFLLEAKFIVYIASIINFYLFAPSDTKKRPLFNKFKRRKRKIYTLLITSMYFLLTYIVNNYFSLLILTSIIILILLTNPFIYCVFNEPYRNYLKIRKEDL